MAAARLAMPTGAATELEQNGFQQFPVHQIKSDRVHIEHFQGGVSHVVRDFPGAFDFSIVSDAPEQTIGNTGCSAGAAGDFPGALFDYRRFQEHGTSCHDSCQVVDIVKFEPCHDAETIP